MLTTVSHEHTIVCWLTTPARTDIECQLTVMPQKSFMLNLHLWIIYEILGKHNSVAQDISF